jgi:centromere/kinetochore protein ZW10
MEERSVLKDRLLKVQKAVHKATEEAWKQAAATSPRSSIVVNDNDNDNDNASFMLGMDLFGQDVSILERAVRDKLEDVEEDWKKLLVLYNDNDEMDTSVDHHHHHHHHQVEQDAALNPQELAHQARLYQQKIDFLKQASWARTLLDESQTLSSSALNSGESNYVQASQQLVQALQHVTQAQEIVQQSESTSSPQDLQVAHQILESLRHAIRRHRVALVHKACNVLDTSIQISSNGLSSKASTQLEAAYQVLETLEGGHAALETTLRRLTHRLYKEVLSPLLEPHRLPKQQQQQQQSTMTTSPWKVVESADKPTKGLIGVSTSTNKGPVHRLEWHRDEHNNTNQAEIITSPIAAWKDTLGVLQRILHFVQTKLLLERPALRQLVGNRLFGKPTALPSQLNLQALGLDESLSSKTVLLGGDQGLLMEDLVELISQTCLPDFLEVSSSSSSSQTMDTLNTTGKELLAICVPFCKSLLDTQLLPHDPPPKLVVFCQHFCKHYVEHRRCVLLNQARDILRNNDYHNTVEVGVPVDVDAGGGAMTIFQLHRSSISDTSSKIMILVRKTMDEAVAQQQQQQETTSTTTTTTTSESDSALSLLRPTLYRTAREMLSLFRAIIPASHGSEVAHVPRTAALLHNDCIFLAHHCLTLGLEYQEQLGNNTKDNDDDDDARGRLLQQTCIFVDMVPLFRELADQSMGDMLDLQKHQLAEIVGNRITYLGKALQSDESLHEWSEAETALAAGIYHLRHLSQAWKPILSSQIFGRSMGYLADVIFTLYLQQILTHATDISPSASQFTSGLVGKARDEIGRLFDGGTIDGSSEWERFGAVGKFLEMNHLGEVQAALSHGVFVTLASQELVRLVQATFGDSPERRALLHTLASV